MSLLKKTDPNKDKPSPEEKRKQLSHSSLFLMETTSTDRTFWAVNSYPHPKTGRYVFEEHHLPTPEQRAMLINQQPIDNLKMTKNEIAFDENIYFDWIEELNKIPA